MNPAIFENFKDQNLSRPLIILKRVGQVSFGVMALGIVIAQLNQGKVGGNPFLDFIAFASFWGFLVGILCFAIVGLATLGKTKNNTTFQAMGKALLKIFLFIFLPAIIITIILFLVVGFPENR